MAQYPKIESIGSMGSIILAILEVQASLRRDKTLLLTLLRQVCRRRGRGGSESTRQRAAADTLAERGASIPQHL